MMKKIGNVTEWEILTSKEGYFTMVSTQYLDQSSNGTLRRGKS